MKMYVRTLVETQHEVLPVDYSYPPGNVRRYGATGDRVTDDTQAFQDAIYALCPLEDK